MQFLARNGVKATKANWPLIFLNARREAPGPQTKAGTLFTSLGDANMKPLLHLKTVVLLLYVALCTHAVLTAIEGENPATAGQFPHIMGE